MKNRAVNLRFIVLCICYGEIFVRPCLRFIFAFISYVRFPYILFSGLRRVSFLKEKALLYSYSSLAPFGR